MLARQAAAVVGVRTCVDRGKLLLRCRLLCGARRIGAHRGGEGRGHIVAAARLQLVITAVYFRLLFNRPIFFRSFSMLGRVPIRGTSEDCWCRLLYEPDALPVAQNNSVKTPNE